MARTRSFALLVSALVLAPHCARSAREQTPSAERASSDAGHSRNDAGMLVPTVTTIPMKSVVAVTLPADAVCRHAAGQALRGASGECARDEDCTARAYGRCAPVNERNTCVYDECVADSECERASTGTLCACAGDEGSAVNRCVPGNCRSDGDCAPGDHCQAFRCRP